MFILKFDFEKAFEKAYHSFILGVLGHKGFLPKWCHCIMHILSSTFSFVLLNGVPSSLIRCKRGVGQVDLLPLAIFVLAIEFFQTIVNEAMFQGHVIRTLPLLCTNGYPISCGS
jgi:hypothetical protein